MLIFYKNKISSNIRYNVNFNLLSNLIMPGTIILTTLRKGKECFKRLNSS